MRPTLVSSLSVSNATVDAGDVVHFTLTNNLSLPSTSDFANITIKVNLEYLSTSDAKDSLTCSLPDNSSIINGHLVLSVFVSSVPIRNEMDLSAIPFLELKCTFSSIINNDVHPTENITYNLDVTYISNQILYDNGSSLILNASDTVVIHVSDVDLIVSANPNHQPVKAPSASPSGYSVVASGEVFDFSARVVIPESTTNLSICATLLACYNFSVNCYATAPSDDLTLALISHNVSSGDSLEAPSTADSSAHDNKFDTIRVDLGVITNVYDNVLDKNDYLTISLQVNISSLQTDRNLRLDVKAFYQNGADRIAFVSRSLDILLTRPRLDFNIEQAPTHLYDAGDSVTYSLSIAHTENSLVPATKLKILLSHDLPFVVVDHARSGYALISGNPTVRVELMVDEATEIPLEVLDVFVNISVLMPFVLSNATRPCERISMNATLQYGDKGAHYLYNNS